MFIARTQELNQLQKAFASESRTAVLIYGKRRVGKSCLIQEAEKSFDGSVISFLCVRSTFEGNLQMLSDTICETLGFPKVSFHSLEDIFQFLEQTGRRILLVLDEYQYLKETLRNAEVDSHLQGILDHQSPRVKLVLCGSYVTIMRELLSEENPLFGRFTDVIHLREMDYCDSSLFYPDLAVQDKASFYAVFGGSPYVNSVLNPKEPLAQNLIKLLLPGTGILRIYIENVCLREIQKAYDVRILGILGNGKKKYSELQTTLGTPATGILARQLENLLSMETIRKTSPMNRKQDARKQFYEISDNLMRFYFAYLFGKEGIISRIGEKQFYLQYIAPSIGEFIARRFDEIARQYFERKARAGGLPGIEDIGTYWYDDARARINGEFDCVLKFKESWSFYECKFWDKPLSKSVCDQEAAQVHRIPGLASAGVGFVSVRGYDFKSEEYDLIDGEDLYRA